MANAQRIVELWSALSPDDQETLVSAAEHMASQMRSHRLLSPREGAAIKASREDFAAGRVLDEQQYTAAMDDFMARLRERSAGSA